MRAITACLFLLATLAPAQSTARLEGRVVDQTDLPLRKVTVGLISATTPVPDRTPTAFVEITDGTGKFVFESVPPGEYQISVQRPGWIPSADLQTITLKSGDAKKYPEIKMSALGVISGRVTDQDGDPVSGAMVNVGEIRYVGGRKQESFAGGAMSDDLGRYRIFGINPGRYYVVANPPYASAMVIFGKVIPSLSLPLRDSSVATYYPSSIDLRDAVPVQVASGSDLGGIDVGMRTARIYAVRGKIVVPAGEAATATLVSLIPRSDTPGAGPESVSSDQDGQFAFAGVRSGVYDLRTVRNAHSRGESRKFEGSTALTVRNADVDGVILPLLPTSQITGKLVIEGGELPKADDSSRWVRLVNQDNFEETSGGEVSDDGTFRIDDVGLAKFRVFVSLGVPAYVKSIRFAGRDISSTPLEASSSTHGVLDIVVSLKPAKLTVSARSTSGEAAPGVSVSVWPKSPQLHEVPSWAGDNTTDPEGKFRSTALPPGEYYALAWENIDEQLFQVPQFLAAFESQAALVKLGENAKEAVEVPVIPHDKILAAASKLP